MTGKISGVWAIDDGGVPTVPPQDTVQRLQLVCTPCGRCSVAPQQLTTVYGVKEDKYRHPYRVAHRERRDVGVKHLSPSEGMSGTGNPRTR